MNDLFSQEVVARFNSKFTRIGDDFCWEWSGARGTRGHGFFRFNNTTDYAHRFAWMLANNQLIPEGLVVRHWCDNPSCVNPNHLELGTRQDNSDDRMERTYVPVEVCIRGHELTDSNVYLFKKSNGRTQRNCKKCKTEYAKEYKKMRRKTDRNYGR